MRPTKKLIQNPFEVKYLFNASKHLQLPERVESDIVLGFGVYAELWLNYIC